MLEVKERLGGRRTRGDWALLTVAFCKHRESTRVRLLAVVFSPIPSHLLASLQIAHSLAEVSCEYPPLGKSSQPQRNHLYLSYSVRSSLVGSAEMHRFLKGAGTSLEVRISHPVRPHPFTICLILVGFWQRLHQGRQPQYPTWPNHASSTDD